MIEINTESHTEIVSVVIEKSIRMEKLKTLLILILCINLYVENGGAQYMLPAYYDTSLLRYFISINLLNQPI